MTAKAFSQALARLGWTTRTEAAKALGVSSRQRVGQWALGRRDVPRYIALAIEAHLSVLELRILVGKSGESTESGEATEL